VTVSKTNTARRFFNHPTKNAFADLTYPVFVETMHTLIHKDCGQILRQRQQPVHLSRASHRHSGWLAALIDAV
jgi:hypothetical protein